MSEPLLELDGLTKRFGELTAVDDVTRSVDADDLTALIGPNGAGKTTMYNLMTGTLSPTSGTVRFMGEDVTGLEPHERVQRGLGRSYQVTNVFEGLSVRRNIRAPIIARSNQRWNLLGSTTEEIESETDRVLDLVGLGDIENAECAALSYGDKRRVEIGVALATDPNLILLDEPTAGMNPTETEKMVELIEELNEETNRSFFMTEHDIDIIFSIATRILVLDRGAIIADGTPEDIRQNERVQSAYLGGEA
ncbi:ABC transporter ATP-binding protein [Halorientalis halophila]|uniref:ABC transporter ATP-binding protein n=1 Tax=Halorientalis halophila TaxID=3108499 RepID=UPI0030095128